MAVLAKLKSAHFVNWLWEQGQGRLSFGLAMSSPTPRSRENSMENDRPYGREPHPSMNPHITLLTLGVDDLERAVAFYRDGLGFSTKGIIGSEFEYGAVAFFNLQSGLKLALWPRKSLSAATGLRLRASSALQFSIGHNVSSLHDVDAVVRVAEQEGPLLGVMGIQDKGDVALVRHAYVARTTQRMGVGTTLLRHVEGLVDKPILIGTWADASWAIEFYRRNGFAVVPNGVKDRLLRTYWSIPKRQIETSVVLADRRWMEGRRRASADR